MSNREICERWLRNRLVNPRTGRAILPNGPTYRALEQECRESVGAAAAGITRPSTRRAQLLANLGEQCYNEEDPISMNAFGDLPENELEKIIRIGSGPRKHCFELEIIYEVIRRAFTVGTPPVNPINREPISREDIDRVYEAVRRIDPRVRNPYESAVSRYPDILSLRGYTHAQIAGARRRASRLIESPQDTHTRRFVDTFRNMSIEELRGDLESGLLTGDRALLGTMIWLIFHGY